MGRLRDDLAEVLRSRRPQGGGVLTSEGASLSVLKCYNRADDGLRTRDLQLGKLALYQLSYVRVGGYSSTLGVALVT